METGQGASSALLLTESGNKGKQIVVEINNATGAIQGMARQVIDGTSAIETTFVMGYSVLFVVVSGWGVVESAVAPTLIFNGE